MNSEELISAFLARGFDYMTNAEALQYLNDSYLVDICGDQDWPFLEATVTGVAPLTLPEFESLEYVIDSTELRKLHPLDRRILTDEHPNISETGVPRFYFLSEVNILNVFPVNTTDSLIARYHKTPTRLTGAVVPLIPERFHSLIIDGAASRAYEGSDDYELSASAQANFQTRLQKMREALIEVNRDGPDDFIQITNYDFAGPFGY